MCDADMAAVTLSTADPSTAAQQPSQVANGGAAASDEAANGSGAASTDAGAEAAKRVRNLQKKLRQVRRRPSHPPSCPAMSGNYHVMRHHSVPAHLLVVTPPFLKMMCTRHTKFIFRRQHMTSDQGTSCHECTDIDAEMVVSWKARALWSAPVIGMHPELTRAMPSIDTAATGATLQEAAVPSMPASCSIASPGFTF